MKIMKDAINISKNYYPPQKNAVVNTRRAICILLCFLILNSCVPVRSLAVDDGIHSKTDYHVDVYYEYVYQVYNVIVGPESYFWQQYLLNDDRWVFVQIAERMRSDTGFQFFFDVGERLLSLDFSNIFHNRVQIDPRQEDISDRLNNLIINDSRQEDIVDYYVTALSSLLLTMDTNMEDIRKEQGDADSTMDQGDYLEEGVQLVFDALSLYSGHIKDSLSEAFFSIIGKNTEIVFDSISSFEQAALLEKNIKSYIDYYTLLQLIIDYTADENLKEAASNLQIVSGKCFEYYTQHLLSDYSDTAINVLSDSFVDAVDEVLEQADGSFSPGELRALHSFSQAMTGFNTVKLGAEYIKVVFDSVLNYSDMVLRDYEILAMAEVREALIAEINRLNAQIKSPEDYMAIQDACELLEDLLYVSLRGEYCAYMLYTREHRRSSEYTEDWFNGFSYKLSGLKTILDHHVFPDWEKFAINNADLRVTHPYEVIQNGISTWEEAEQYCESLGGHLATISSEEENSYIYQLMLDSGYSSAYFGLTDSDSEGTWRWVTGEPLTYQNWATNEPNSENPNEDYAMFYYKFTDGKWNDGDFGGKTVSDGIAFICEWDDTLHNYPQDNQATIVIEPQPSPNDNLEPESGLLASGTCGAGGDNLTWKYYYDGRLVIEGTGDMADYNFQEAYPLDTAPWLMLHNGQVGQIKTVDIAEGVTSIGKNAFASYYQENLSTVIIPDTVTRIGDFAFSFLTGLKSVTLPSSIESIGEYAFGETGLTDLYYASSEAEWNEVKKSKQNGEPIFGYLQPPVIHFQSISVVDNTAPLAEQELLAIEAVIPESIPTKSSGVTGEVQEQKNQQAEMEMALVEGEEQTTTTENTSSSRLIRKRVSYASSLYGYETEYYYGQDGRLMSSTDYRDKDENGNWRSSVNSTYEYNEAGQIFRKVSNGGAMGIYRYSYDGAGRLVRESMFQFTDNDPQYEESRTDYIYSGDALVEEHHYKFTGMASDYTLSFQYQYDGSRIIGKDEYRDDEMNAKYHYKYEYDNYGNLSEETAFDNSGNLFSRTTYEYELIGKDNAASEMTQVEKTQKTEQELLAVLESHAGRSMDKYIFVDMDHDGAMELLGGFMEHSDNPVCIWYCSSDGSECVCFKMGERAIDMEFGLNELDVGPESHIAVNSFFSTTSGSRSCIIGLRDGHPCILSKINGDVYQNENGDIVFNASEKPMCYYDAALDSFFVHSCERSYLFFNGEEYSEYSAIEISEAEFLAYQNAQSFKGIIESELTKNNTAGIDYSYFIRNNGLLHVRCVVHEANGSYYNCYYTVSFTGHELNLKSMQLSDGFFGSGISGLPLDQFITDASHTGDAEAIVQIVPSKSNQQTTIEIAPAVPFTTAKTIYGRALLDGKKRTLEEKVKVISDSYYDRKTSGGFRDGYIEKSNSNNETGYRLGFYFADGLVYYAEVTRNNQWVVKLYYWNGDLVACRDYRGDWSLAYPGSDTFEAVAKEFAIVYEIGMDTLK